MQGLIIAGLALVAAELGLLACGRRYLDCILALFASWLRHTLVFPLRIGLADGNILASLALLFWGGLRGRRGPAELPQRLPGSPVGYSGGQHRAGGPRPRQSSYFPDWLLEQRRRPEQALVSVVATSYLLGVLTPQVKKLGGTLGIKSLSKEPGVRAC
jgi:Transposase, Mutator family